MSDVKRCHFGLLSDMMAKLSQGEVVSLNKEGRLFYTDKNKVVEVDSFSDLEMPDAQYVLEIIGSTLQKNIQGCLKERQSQAIKKANDARMGKGLVQATAGVIPGA